MVLIDFVVFGVASGAMAGQAVPVGLAPDGLDLGKGAILGAVIVGAAFLAGMAVLRRSATAVCGLVMLAAGAALLALWLGMAPGVAPTFVNLIGAIFAASALIFVSSAIGLAKRSQLIGGVLFAGALCLAGIGVINATLGGEAAGLMRIGIGLAAATAIGLSLLAGARGDGAARLILPGAALAAAAPLLIGASSGTGAMALAPHAVFAIGILIASLVAMNEFSAAPQTSTAFSPDMAAHFSSRDETPSARGRYERENSLRVSENQLAQVLDYAGVAVLDWNRDGAHQSLSFGAVMGADCNGQFTPETLREFVHKESHDRFDQNVIGAAMGDGGFDETLKLHNGKKVRMRGARAVDSAGALERIVVFVEDASSDFVPSVRNDALKAAAASLTAGVAAIAEAPKAVAPTAKKLIEAKPDTAPAPSVARAIENGAIVAAFQPIVSFESGEVSGVEALLRWPGFEKSGGAGLSTEDIVRHAQESGKGAKLAAIMMEATAKYVADKIASGDRKFFGAFNVSLSQIKEPGFVEAVRDTITAYKLPKGALVLELTEGERLTETPKINDTFRKLTAAGASLAYDDFGAGFSSLGNLHKHEFDYLKIDKSFIDDIVANGGKKKIVSALAKLGKDFGMTVIAEGIESAEAAETAKTIGCRMGQGYHLGKPITPMTPESPAAPESVIVDAAADHATTADTGQGAIIVASDQSEVDILVLDKSLEAAKTGNGKVRRRLFSGSRRN